jgi:hypothetical protein
MLQEPVHVKGSGDPPESVVRHEQDEVILVGSRHEPAEAVVQQPVDIPDLLCQRLLGDPRVLRMVR